MWIRIFFPETESRTGSRCERDRRWTEQRTRTGLARKLRKESEKTRCIGGRRWIKGNRCLGVMWKILQTFTPAWNKIFDSQNSYLLLKKTCISSHFGVGPGGKHPAAAVLYLVNSWRREALKVLMLFVRDKTMPPIWFCFYYSHTPYSPRRIWSWLWSCQKLEMDRIQASSMTLIWPPFSYRMQFLITGSHIQFSQKYFYLVHQKDLISSCSIFFLASLSNMLTCVLFKKNTVKGLLWKQNY